MQSASRPPHNAAAAEVVPNHITEKQEVPKVVVHNGDAGPSSQRENSRTSTTAEAIANFKPSPRDVISGIAPHVFDERRRRRFQKKRATKPYWYGPNGEKRSSPLRGATVMTWDETSIYLEQPDTQRATTAENHETRNPNSPREDKTDQRVTRRVNHNKTGWKYFRVDTQLLKSLVVKLKLAKSQNSGKA
ncbi:hypothetical protein M413DRAFT_447362 [Hebeloma cylindrosporum]|uniref:Uncharacterized protein n=1 Tax=Hebeloma cylindrosporum TaxID=76867 RepID=A0A0C3C3Z1_HEBCY|nr:hypothetical protein M413DRAFT_447362 [Hebeloma cylindrosporum h7]